MFLDYWFEQLSVDNSVKTVIHFWFTCDEVLWVGLDIALTLVMAAKLLWDSGSACWKENVSNLPFRSPVTKNKKNAYRLLSIRLKIFFHTVIVVISRSPQLTTYHLLNTKKSHLNKHLLLILSLLFTKVIPLLQCISSCGTRFILANAASFFRSCHGLHTQQTQSDLEERSPVFPNSTSLAGVHLTHVPVHWALTDGFFLPKW